MIVNTTLDHAATFKRVAEWATKFRNQFHVRSIRNMIQWTVKNKTLVPAYDDQCANASSTRSPAISEGPREHAVS